MQSYKLSRALHDNEVLEFFTSLGAGAPSRYSVDYGLNDEGEAACVLYDSTAGLNATDGDDNNGDGRGKGCHTLKHNEACANLFQT